MTKIEIAVARLENNRAAAPYSRSGIPRASVRGWNLPAVPEVRRCEAVGSPELNAASKARLDRLKTLALVFCAKQPLPTAAPATMAETERKIPMSFNPPRFETKKLKSGPRKGMTVTQEAKWLLRLYTRTVSNGIATFTATARLAKGGEGIHPPQSAGGKAFSTIHQDFTRRWPAQAEELLQFLSFRDCRDEWV